MWPIAVVAVTAVGRAQGTPGAALGLSRMRGWGRGVKLIAFLVLGRICEARLRVASSRYDRRRTSIHPGVSGHVCRVHASVVLFWLGQRRV